MRVNQSSFLRLILHGNFQQLGRYNKPYGSPFSPQFSTIGTKLEKVWHKGPPRSILLGNLDRALKEHQVDEAWETYKDFKRLYGFPDQFLMANLITEMSYSSNSKCLRNACDLVVSISKEKSVLLKAEMMTKLLLSLARAQISVSASRILRLMLEKRSLPSLDVLRVVFLHLVKTDIGTYLASNILCEICDCFHMLNDNKSSQIELTKPDAAIFNLVLDACTRFGSSLKGQQIMELMPRLGVAADAHTVVIISHIHERNGTRDELKKFKDHIDLVPVSLLGHYQQFYDCLLSLHLKFNDINAASALLLDMSGYRDLNPLQRGHLEQQKNCTVSIGSDNIKMGLKLQFLPQKLHKDCVYKVESKQELLMYKNGKFILSNKGLAKLIIGYKRLERINELSKLLIRIQNMLCSKENNSSCCDIVDACIHLGWLEIAHDILEDLESEKYLTRESSYSSLLTAYYNKKMFKEAEALERHIKRDGTLVNSSDDSTCKSYLAESIVQSMKEEDKLVSHLFHEYNSSIYFFTKAKMIEDALKTYRKMHQMKIQPTASTFFHMVSGYSSLGMYREITVLWGDIKRNLENRNSSMNNRDLYELLLLNFIRGGYFERVMEVIGFMMEKRMYLDKWHYKTEFLKFHRDLYRKLTASEALNEAQSRRIDYVQAFRKLVGII
ncbi:hypothetical protein ACJIZ3_004901 [Penstemon smallii]|uniref:At1g68980-like TPR repeats domain-containing protein n=1 Tax=Penstemon smallii TaxID=265156 RepID=A0ABD3S3J9_9LAMI